MSNDPPCDVWSLATQTMRLDAPNDTDWTQLNLGQALQRSGVGRRLEEARTCTCAWPVCPDSKPNILNEGFGALASRI